MAFLGETYRAEDMPASTAIEPVPAGWYSAQIVGAELCDTKAGTGQYVKVRYDIIGPAYQGRVIFGNLNIRNPNPKAEEIGRQQLGEIMAAIGLRQVQDTDELIGGQLEIKVAIRTDPSGQYAPQNEVKGFRALSGSAAPAPLASAPAGAGAPASAAKPSSAPPWAKR
jgi:hypothetical protein